MTKTKEELIELGRELERLESSKFRYLWMGWCCTIMGPFWFFLSVWDFKTRFYGMIGLLVFGILSLYLGYSEKRELKELKQNEKEES